MCALNLVERTLRYIFILLMISIG